MQTKALLIDSLMTMTKTTLQTTRQTEYKHIHWRK